MKTIFGSMILASMLFAQVGVDTTDAEISITSVDTAICTQVITYAQKTENDTWYEFATPCDVPDGWLTTYEKPDNLYTVSTIATENDNILKIEKGWNLLGASEDINSMDAFDRSCAKLLFKYSGGDYTSYSTTLQKSTTSVPTLTFAKNDGFWVYSDGECTVNLTNPELSTATGELVSISGGETKTLYDGALIITVDSINDSRCPMDATCITGGEVSVDFQVTGTKEILESITLKTDETFTTAQGYTIMLREVTPYPMASNPTAFEDMTVEVEIFQ